MRKARTTLRGTDNDANERPFRPHSAQAVQPGRTAKETLGNIYCHWACSMPREQRLANILTDRWRLKLYHTANHNIKHINKCWRGARRALQRQRSVKSLVCYAGQPKPSLAGCRHFVLALAAHPGNLKARRYEQTTKSKHT